MGNLEQMEHSKKEKKRMKYSGVRDYIDRNLLTINGFSKKSGISKGTLHRLYHGTATPTYRTVLRICKATNGDITPENFGYV